MLDKLKIGAKEILAAFLSAHKSTDEQVARRAQFTVMALMAVTAETFFGIADLAQGKYLLFLALMLSAVPLAAGIPLVYRTATPWPIYRFNTFMAALACLVLTTTGGEHSSKALWLYTIPLVAFLLFPPLEAALWAGTEWAAAMLLMSFSPNSIVRHDYPGEFITRLGTTYFFICVIIWWYDRQRHRNHMEMNAAVDLLARRQAALRESESKYRLLFVNMSSAFAQCELPPGGAPETCRIVEVNASFERLTGTGSREITGRSLAEIFSAEDRWLFSAVREAAGSGRPVREENFSAGLKRNLEVSIYNSAPDRMALLLNDITERKRTEEERIKAQRMESIATLSGGMAHDFNNILTGILGDISLTRTELPPQNTEAAQLLREAEDAAMQAQVLARQLLTFAKGDKPVKTAVDLGRLAAETAVFALRGTNARCDIDLPPDLWSVMADRGQLIQVFQSLLLNAAQAMPGGGVVNITGKNIPPAPGNAAAEGKIAVEISVADTGKGIPPEDLPRLFDPYFSTKAPGRGLGLSMAHSIIYGHGGAILAQSEPGKGSVFRVRLPASAVPAADPAAGRPAPSPVLAGPARVLIMDDEEIVLKACARMLAALGHECSTAPDGAAAIETYCKAAAEGRPFGLVIMDLTVPGCMGGEEAVLELKKLHPAAKVMVSSGYSDDPIMSDFAQYGFDGALAKPYRLEELAALLGKIS